MHYSLLDFVNSTQVVSQALFLYSDNLFVIKTSLIEMIDFPYFYHNLFYKVRIGVHQCEIALGIDLRRLVSLMHNK